MIFGYTDYIVTADAQPFFNEILKQNIPASKITRSNEEISLRVPVGSIKKFQRMCLEKNFNYKIIEKKGSFFLIQKILKRPGIIAGFLICCIAFSVLSNVVIKLDVLTDDPLIEKKIIQALESEGITVGTYIPNINYTQTERAVRRKVDEVSWVGISQNGSGLVLSIMENIESEEKFHNRLPSNLVCVENGVIEKLEVLDGQVVIGVGSGVSKGDVIVSGEIINSKSQWIDGKEVVDTKISYARSIGKVYGTFERTMVFTQPFEERVEITSLNEKEIKYLNVFSANIPLFFNMPQGYYKSSSNYSPLPKIFGLQLPLGITSVSLTEYDFLTKQLTQQQAEQSVAHQAFDYETNFLKNYEIKDRESTVTTDENGVTMTVHYTLYGQMTKESFFFIPKN